MGLDASVSVMAIKTVDEEKHRQMLAIKENCEELDIALPEEVLDYFGGETASELGREFFVGSVDMIRDAGSCRKGALGTCITTHYTTDEGDESGLVIDLELLPEDVRYLKISGDLSY